MGETTMNERGLTLIEALVATTILGLILALTAGMFSSGARVMERETVMVDLLADMSGAKNIVLEDLSIAGYRPDAVALGPIVAVSPAGNQFDSIEFVGDVDSDGNSERVCYSVNAGVLERSIEEVAANPCGTTPGATATLAERIQTFAVSFWDDSNPRVQLGHAAVLAGDAATARVTLSLQDTVRGQSLTPVITGEVALRNG